LLLNISSESRVSIEGVVLGDGEQEVFLNILVLGAPDLLTAFIDNGVLVRVVGNGSGTRQGGEEVWEEFGFRGNREREVGEDRSEWGGRGNNGNRGFSDRRWEVFDGDISKQDTLDDFFKLKVDVGVLMFWGQGVLKLRAYYVSLLGGNIGEDVEEVGWGGDNGGQGQGAIGVRARGRVITTWAGVIPGVVGTIEVVLDNLVGGSNIDLIGVVDLRPVGNRESGGDDKGG
jgi:hypothetical protein